jgi:hypothetical protein
VADADLLSDCKETLEYWEREQAAKISSKESGGTVSSRTEVLTKEELERRIDIRLPGLSEQARRELLSSLLEKGEQPELLRAIQVKTYEQGFIEGKRLATGLAKCRDWAWFYSHEVQRLRDCVEKATNMQDLEGLHKQILELHEQLRPKGRSK